MVEFAAMFVFGILGVLGILYLIDRRKKHTH